MDAATVEEAYRLFTTTVGLITTNGSRGPNVMSAEWTFNVSYEPFLIAVVLEAGEATFDAIRETKEFGVSLISEEHVTAMGFAGHFTHHDTDKLSSDLFETQPAKKIRAPLIKGAVLTAECRLVQEVPTGDHVTFIGEVVELSVDPSKRPVVLHRGPHRLGERIERPAAIAVAVTPTVAVRGGDLKVSGELTARQNPHMIVEISVMGPQGEEAMRAVANSDGRPYFETVIHIPSEFPAGRYEVIARSGRVSGRARLELRSGRP